MANFVRVKPAGYSTNDPITSAELNQLDTDHVKAVNGDEGGSYAGDVIWSGQHDFEGAVNANGLTTFSGPVKLFGTTTGIQNRVGTVGNADATIDVAKDEYYFTAAPTVNRSYTLRHSTAPIPAEGQRIRVTMTLSSVTADAIFKREGGTEIGRIKGVGNGGFLEFTYVTVKGWIVSGAGADGVYTVPH